MKVLLIGVGYWYGNEIEWLGANAMKEAGLVLLSSATLFSERAVTDEDGNELKLRYRTYICYALDLLEAEGLTAYVGNSEVYLKGNTVLEAESGKTYTYSKLSMTSCRVQFLLM